MITSKDALIPSRAFPGGVPPQAAVASCGLRAAAGVFIHGYARQQRHIRTALRITAPASERPGCAYKGSKHAWLLGAQKFRVRVFCRFSDSCLTVSQLAEQGQHGIFAGNAGRLAR